MPQVKITHQNITDDSAKEAPPREAIPPGIYHALIMAAVGGITTGTNLVKLTIEYQLLFEDATHNDALAGRRVFQQYVLEPVPDPNMAALHRHELRQLLDATGIPYTADGFNSDHLLTKTVKITVKQKTGKVADEAGKLPVFSNVVRVDTAETVAEGDIV